LVPFAGSIVLTDPFVQDPSGLLVPDRVINPAEVSPPLMVATEMPDLVEPITAYVEAAELQAERLRMDAMLMGDTHKAIMYSPHVEVRMKLNLVLESERLTREQLYSAFVGRGSKIKFWVEA